MPAADTYQQLCDHARETQLLATISALLDWDQQTHLPAAGGPYRAEQIKYLAGNIHRRQTDPRLGDWLAELAESELAADPHSESGATIRELKYQFTKKCKLPVDLVQELAAACSQGQQVWTEARQTDDFAKLRPNLEQIFQLKRRQAEAVGEMDCLYDALLDDFEPGAETERVAQVLDELKNQLVPLLAEINSSSDHVDGELLRRRFPCDAQKQFVIDVTKAIGFDYGSGQIDVAPHPFCTELGPSDCRITTRYAEHFLNSAVFGSLHEAGHGMYEQGLPKQHYGLPPGRYCSLGIHESQSRLWENLVGRSRGFWEYFYPSAQRQFANALGDVPLDAFLAAINQVKPSLIRVTADEATYNLHIIIRFELEQDVLNEQLPVAELPAAWNQKYQEYLGITPPTDGEGVLQDIHWSAGLIGYFPTYSLGNIYASQFYQAAESELGELQTQFAKGQFRPLHNWLCDNIYQAGNCWRAHDLVRRVTGQPIDHRPLIKHLRNKLAPIYGL